MGFLWNFGHHLIHFIWGVLVFVVVMCAAFWVYGDAERRGKSGCLAMLLVVLIPFPLGLIAWLLFRPNDTRGGL